MAFATRNNPAPAFCENGEPGEEKKVKVELKLLADVGLIGYPNVGKSTIFNLLTGMNQHTGNWAGKTVSVAEAVVKGISY